MFLGEIFKNYKDNPRTQLFQLFLTFIFMDPLIIIL